MRVVVSPNSDPDMIEMLYGMDAGNQMRAIRGLPLKCPMFDPNPTMTIEEALSLSQSLHKIHDQKFLSGNLADADAVRP